MNINTANIQSVIEQMRSVVNQAGTDKLKLAQDAQDTVQAPGFADAFKAQLNEIQSSQQQARDLGQRFSLGDDSVNLSDVMMAGQKASIQLQTAIQVRNKLVSVYHDIMNMQI